MTGIRPDATVHRQTAPNHFDETFKGLFTILTMNELHHHPLMLAEGADYSGLASFVAGRDTSVLAAGVAVPSLAADRLWLDNLKFADSKDVPSVQIIDLIVSGFRRVLRGAFAENDRAAGLLGALCIARIDNDAVKIVTLGAGPDTTMHRETVRTLHILSMKAMKL